MTIAVDLGRKATKQTDKHIVSTEFDGDGQGSSDWKWKRHGKIIGQDKQQSERKIVNNFLPISFNIIEP